VAKLAELKLPSSLQNARIEGLPEAAYYISEFITEEEEGYLLDKVLYISLVSIPRIH
jgi:hypothetical protein